MKEIIEHVQDFATLDPKVMELKMAKKALLFDHAFESCYSPLLVPFIGCKQSMLKARFKTDSITGTSLEMALQNAIEGKRFEQKY